MAMVNAELPHYAPDLISSFAGRRKSSGGKSTRRTIDRSITSTTTPPNDSPPKFNKRTLLLLGGLTLTGVGIASILKPWERLIPQEPEEVKLYYPELQSLRLYENSEFKTTKTDTRWFNYTDARFKPDVAKATFDFFEKLGETEKTLQYRIGGQSIPYKLLQKPRTSRVLFLIPENAHIPGWHDVAQDGSTTGAFRGPYASFVRLYNSDKNIPPSFVFTDRRLAFSKVFGVEAFQSSISISSVSTDAANLGQEIVANSYGSAFAIKQQGILFVNYKSWAQNVSIRKDALSLSYPIYILSEEEFNEIPILGLPIE